METPSLLKVTALAGITSLSTLFSGCSTKIPTFRPVPIQPSLQSLFHGNDEPKDDCERDVVAQTQGWLDKYGREMDENIMFYSPPDEIKNAWDAKKFLSALQNYLAPPNGATQSRAPEDYNAVRSLNERLWYNNRFEPARILQKALGAKGPSFEHFNCRW
ncbi:MAG: hypothetical protein H6860_04365 [Rhodospirillales bacterium]|nr:hypothetical protein [Alphaproteobacteria bacterium]MCB9981614.1 hypothetical protein [Rhodospirillales bacterium]